MRDGRRLYADVLMRSGRLRLNECGRFSMYSAVDGGVRNCLDHHGTIMQLTCL